MTAPSASHILLLLCDSSRLLRRCLEGSISDLGLSESQWRVLGVVYTAPEMSQRELALILGLRQAPLVRLLDLLEHRGLLKRLQDPGDARVNRLKVTRRGELLAQRLSERYRLLQKQLMLECGQDRWQNLQQALVALAAQRCPVALRQALERLTLTSSLHLLGVLCRQLRRDLSQYLQDSSPLHWLLLRHLSKQPGANQRELTELLGVNKVVLTRALTELEQRNWLVRKVDPGDRRCRQLTLTALGKQCRQQLCRHADKGLEQTLNALPIHQQETLIDGLQSLQSALITNADWRLPAAGC